MQAAPFMSNPLNRKKNVHDENRMSMPDELPKRASSKVMYKYGD